MANQGMGLPTSVLKGLSAIKPKIPFTQSELLKGIKLLSAAQQKTVIQAIKTGGDAAAKTITSILTPIMTARAGEAAAGAAQASTQKKGWVNMSEENLRSILDTMYNSEGSGTNSSSQGGSTTDKKTGGIDA